MDPQETFYAPVYSVTGSGRESRKAEETHQISANRMVRFLSSGEAVVLPLTCLRKRDQFARRLVAPVRIDDTQVLSMTAAGRIPSDPILRPSP